MKNAKSNGNTRLLALFLILLISFTYATDAIAAYRSNTGTNTLSSPKIRYWNSTSSAWGSEVELPTAGSPIRHIRVRTSSASDKTLIVTLSDDGNLDAYVCNSNCGNAGSWTVTNDIGKVWTTAPTPSQRRFAIFSFEKTTGNALVIYSVENTNTAYDIAYKVLPAESTSFTGIPEQYIDDTGHATDIQYGWMMADTNPTNGSNEIILAAFDTSDSDINAWVWNGSAWGSQQELTAAATATGGYDALGVKYSADGTKGIVVGATGTAGAVNYQYWNGASWTAAASLGDVTSGNDDVQWIQISSDPASDDIMVIGITSDGGMSSSYWNGATWANTVDVDTGTDASASRAAAFAWNPSGSTGQLAWDTDTTGTTLSNRTFSAGAWGSTTTFSTYAGTGAWMWGETNPISTDSVKSLWLRLNSNFDIGSFSFSGTSYTNYGDSAFTADTTVSTYEAFHFTFYKPPLPSVTLNSPVDNSNFSTSSITLNWTPSNFASNPTCNVTRVNGGAVLLFSGVCTNNAPCTTTNVTSDGTYSWNVTCYQGSDTKTSATRTFRVDTTAPTTTPSAVNENGSAYTFNTWTTSPYVNVTLSCNDGTGVGCDKTVYCTDTTNTCTPSTAYSAPVQISTAGTSYIRYRSNDTLNNTNSVQSQTIKIDSTAPSTTASAVLANGSTYSFGNVANTNYVNITLSCSDATSGCSATYYCNDTANSCTPSTAYSGTIQISSETTSYVRYYSNDSAGNSETIKNQTIKIDRTAPSVTINSPANNSVVGSKTISINLTIIEQNINYTNISIVQPTQTLTSFSLSIYGKYDGGSGHVVNLYLWNYSSSTWVIVGTLPNSATLRWYNFTGLSMNSFMSGGLIRAQISHDTSGNQQHYLFLDYVQLKTDSTTYNITSGFVNISDGSTNTYLNTTSIDGVAWIIDETSGGGGLPAYQLFFNFTGVSNTIVGGLINSTTSSQNGTFTINMSVPNDGVYDINITSYDLIGFSTSKKNTNITVSTAPPTTTADALTADSDTYDFGSWTNATYVNITLSCYSPLACDKTVYCTDTTNTCSPSTVYTSAVQISAEGTTYIRYMSNDTVGNTEAVNDRAIRIDKTPPNVTINSPSSNATLQNWTIPVNITVGDANLNHTNISITQPTQNISTFSVSIYGKYDGGQGHVVDLYLWNYSGSSWANFGRLANSQINTWYNFTNINMAQFMQGGTIISRIEHDSGHNANHHMDMDLVQVKVGTTSYFISSAFVNISNGEVNSYLNTTSIDGVAWIINETGSGIGFQFFFNFTNVSNVYSGGVINSTASTQNGTFIVNITVPDDGIYDLEVVSYDNAGSSTTRTSTNLKVAVRPPSTSPSGITTESDLYSFGTWASSSSVNTTLSCYSLLGCDKTFYCIDANNSCSPNIIYSSQIQISAQGITYLRFYSNDSLGRNESVQNVSIMLDNVVPATNITAVKSDGSPYEFGTVAFPYVNVTLLCSDSTSGCGATYYCTDTTNTCTPSTTYSGTIQITTGGTSYIRFYSEDNATNSEALQNRTIVIETGVAPTVTIQSPVENATYLAQPDLNYTLSGSIDSCWYTLNSGANISLPGCANTTISPVKGTNNLTVYANNSFGNIGSASVSFYSIGPPSTWMSNLATISQIAGHTCISRTVIVSVPTGTANDIYGGTLTISSNRGTYIIPVTITVSG